MMATNEPLIVPDDPFAPFVAASIERVTSPATPRNITYSPAVRSLQADIDAKLLDRMDAVCRALNVKKREFIAKSLEASIQAAHQALLRAGIPVPDAVYVEEGR
jgi:hypothetical protein